MSLAVRDVSALTCPSTLPSSGPDPSPETENATPVIGYQIARRIGAGGMGEIVLAHEQRLDRDVAIKRLRTPASGPHAEARFLREARIQARLDHPAVAPVYELGFDVRGAPYFSMRRLTGRTLAQMFMWAGRDGTTAALRAFVDVCLAVEFAHARGVVHRDLKPDNIMLGDFGEVYVLDWGVARLLDEPALLEEGCAIEASGQLTGDGAIVGTPGYMAPEQILGVAAVGPSTDVYALGAILFEILTHTPLHPRGAQAVASTLDLDPAAVANRCAAEHRAPELDSIIAAALQLEPHARPTARAIAEAVQRFLDGDRDLALRQSLAAAELEVASSRLAEGDATARADAIRCAGRALAFVPDHAGAAALASSLLLHPPQHQPPGLEIELAESDVRVQRRQARAAASALVVLLVFVGLALLEGAVRPVAGGLVMAYAGLLASVAVITSRRAATRRQLLAIGLGNALLASLLSGLFGPFVIAPMVTGVMMLSVASYPQLARHGVQLVIIFVASWIAPVTLELAGVLPSSWDVVAGTLVIHSRLVGIGSGTTALLVGGNIAGIVVIGTFASSIARARRDAQRQVEIQAWHLRQLLPPTVTHS